MTTYINKQNQSKINNQIITYLDLGLLPEYIKIIASKELFQIYHIFEHEDVVIKLSVLQAISNELNRRQNNDEEEIIFTSRTSFQALKIFFESDKLSEYLKTLSDSELAEAESALFVDDIVGLRQEILILIRLEQESRVSKEAPTKLQK